MDEQIVKSLIELYREKGIDLYGVIDDPLFASLPTSAKLEMLKKHADEIANGTPRAISKAEIKGALKQALAHAVSTGVLGGLTVHGALKYYDGGRVHWPAMTTVALTSGVVGGMSAINRLQQLKNTRNQIGDHLDDLAYNPTDRNAIRVLAMRNMQNRSKGGDSPFQKLKDLPSKIIDERATPFLIEHTMGYNEAIGTPRNHEFKDADEIIEGIISRNAAASSGRPL